jgi:hypothetical protein
MKKLGILMAFLFVFALLTTPITSFAQEDDLDETMKDIEVIVKMDEGEDPLGIEKHVLKLVGYPMERLAAILDLDEKTEKKVEEMALQHKEEMIDIRSKIEKQEVAMERILLEDKLDTKKLLAKYKEISKLKEEIAIKRIEHKLKIYDLIPADKKKDAKEIMFRRHSHLRLGGMGDLGEFRKGMHTLREKMGFLKKRIKRIREECEEHKKF